MHRGSRLVAHSAQRIHDRQICRQPRLHVAATAAKEPVALDARFEGRAWPHVQRPDRDHVHMPIENQGAALFLAWTMRSHDVDGVAVVDLDGRKARMVLDVLHPNLPAIHRIAAPLQGIEPEVLRRMLLTTQRRVAHQITDKLYLLIETLIDCVDDLLGEFWVQRHTITSCCFCTANRATSGICQSLPGTAARSARV